MKILISSLRSRVAEGNLSSQEIEKAIAQLRALGHPVYDENKFPALKEDHVYGAYSTRYKDLEAQNFPVNLAEAMIWKLGRWSAYKSFVKNYENSSLVVSDEGGVVMSAFAKHLQNRERPIYDQHAIRSLWAIGRLDTGELAACEALLVDGAGNWKESGSGKYAVACYELFVTHTARICNNNAVSLRELDLLMMPLGQALKKVSRGKNKGESDLQVFKEICGL